jgi:hypothetical protein
LIESCIPKSKEMKMKGTVRVSFDVPIDEHTLVKAACVEAHINFRDLMKDVFHKTAENLKKKRLHDILTKGFQEAKEGKTKRLTQEDLDKWSKMIDNA